MENKNKTYEPLYGHPFSWAASDEIAPDVRTTIENLDNNNWHCLICMPINVLKSFLMAKMLINEFYDVFGKNRLLIHQNNLFALFIFTGKLTEYRKQKFNSIINKYKNLTTLNSNNLEKI